MILTLLFTCILLGEEREWHYVVRLHRLHGSELPSFGGDAVLYLGLISAGLSAYSEEEFAELKLGG